MTTRHDLHTVLSGPLMIDHRALSRLIDEVRCDIVASNRSSGGVPQKLQEPVLMVGMHDSNGAALPEYDGSGHAPGSLVAVVPLVGLVTRHGYAGWFSSAPGTLEIGRALQAMDRDESIGAIVMSVNSPGGSVWGTPELASLVYEIRKAGKTKLVACVDPMMASAATYIATACESVYCIPSGDCGSIGVLNGYTDYSGYLEKAGIKTEILRVPEKKARFSGVEPMTDEMRQQMQSGIESAYEIFVADMARNRGVTEKQVREKFGQGEMMSARESMDAGLIDGVMSIDQVLGELTVGAQSKKREYMRKRASLQLEAAAADVVTL